jgi:hypothetical protein
MSGSEVGRPVKVCFEPEALELAVWRCINPAAKQAIREVGYYQDDILGAWG